MKQTQPTGAKRDGNENQTWSVINKGVWDVAMFTLGRLFD